MDVYVYVQVMQQKNYREMEKKLRRNEVKCFIVYVKIYRLYILKTICSTCRIHISSPNQANQVFFSLIFIVFEQKPVIN